MLSTRKKLAHSAAVSVAVVLAACSIPNTSASSDVGAVAARQFNLYFDVDGTGLTPEARKIVAQAVAEADPDANLTVSAPQSKLARRRSEAVRDALVAGGISPDRIGEGRFPHDPPAPGVLDPRARMVQITVQ